MALHSKMQDPWTSSSQQDLEEDTLSSRIQAIRQQLGARLLILGHHYQQEKAIQYADLRGDSFLLARQAVQNRTAQYIVFLGVRFMAETADIVTSPNQAVILPDP